MKTVVVIFILFFAYDVHAYRMSNMMLNYPTHDCYQPSKPFEPFSNDEVENEIYERDMRTYNDAMNDFEECLTDYISTAERDIDTINDAIYDARRELNSIF